MFIYSYEVLENTVFELNPLELKKRTEKLSLERIHQLLWSIKAILKRTFLLSIAVHSHTDTYNKQTISEPFIVFTCMCSAAGNYHSLVSSSECTVNQESARGHMKIGREC